MLQVSVLVSVPIDALLNLVYVPIDALLNWAFQLPREEERVSRTEAQASITEARLSEFSQALTDVRNSMEYISMIQKIQTDPEFSQALTDVRNAIADISMNQKIQTDAVTDTMSKGMEGLSEKLGEITNSQLNAMDKLVKMIENLDPSGELRESIWQVNQRVENRRRLENVRIVR